MLGVLGSLLSIILFFFNEGDISFTLFETKIQEKTPLVYIFVASAFILLVVFALGVFWLKKSTRKLVNREFYNPQVINSFNKSGKAFVFVGLASLIISFLAHLILDSRLNISITPWGNSNFYLIITGLFFLLFGKVLAQGKILKDENDLTI